MLPYGPNFKNDSHRPISIITKIVCHRCKKYMIISRNRLVDYLPNQFIKEPVRCHCTIRSKLKHYIKPKEKFAWCMLCPFHKIQESLVRKECMKYMIASSRGYFSWRLIQGIQLNADFPQYFKSAKFINIADHKKQKLIKQKEKAEQTLKKIAAKSTILGGSQLIPPNQQYYQKTHISTSIPGSNLPILPLPHSILQHQLNGSNTQFATSSKITTTTTSSIPQVSNSNTQFETSSNITTTTTSSIPQTTTTTLISNSSPVQNLNQKY